jgi:hypothetical protein
MKKLSYFPILVMILFAKFVPFNWIVGSYRCAFSLTTIFAPVMAKQFGFGWISLFFISKNWFSFAAMPGVACLSLEPLANSGSVASGSHVFFSCLLLSLLHRTPLLFASFAYRTRHWFTSIFLPALCMLLFVSDAVGSVAWCYSLYWVIPMILYFVKNSLLTRALGASFVAHSVGSVIWLYTGNISAEIWIGLIPIVVCERLLMTAGMLALDMAITHVRAAQPWQTFCKRLGFA